MARRATVPTTVAAPTASAEDGESPAAARKSLRAALQRMLPGVFDRSMEPVAPDGRATADELMQPPPKRKVGVAHATHATPAAAAFVDATPRLIVLPVGCAESEAAATPPNGQVLEEEADDEDDVAARAEMAVVTEAEGLHLHLSGSSSTGYKCVYSGYKCARFYTHHRVDGRLVHLGTFDTAVEAAVVYARAVEEMQGERLAKEWRLNEMQGERPAKERRLNEMQGERPAKERRLNRVGLAYRCAHCGLPKRGHVCTLLPAKLAVPAMPPPPPPAKDVAVLAAAAASAMIAGGGGGAAQRGGGAAGASSAGAPPPSDAGLLSVTVPYGCVPGQTLELSTPAGKDARPRPSSVHASI